MCWSSAALKKLLVNIIRLCQLILIPLTVLVAVAGHSSEQKEELDSSIVESVFRYQIRQCGDNTSLKVFLLSVRGNDPSDEFMKRFTDDSLSVKRRSALAKSEATSEFIDNESGKSRWSTSTLCGAIPYQSRRPSKEVRLKFSMHVI